MIIWVICVGGWFFEILVVLQLWGKKSKIGISMGRVSNSDGTRGLGAGDRAVDHHTPGRGPFDPLMRSTGGCELLLLRYDAEGVGGVTRMGEGRENEGGRWRIEDGKIGDPLPSLSSILYPPPSIYALHARRGKTLRRRCGLPLPIRLWPGRWWPAPWDPPGV
jgi:hypothetical protein